MESDVLSGDRMTGNYYVRPELPQKCPFILERLLENRRAELPFALGNRAREGERKKMRETSSLRQPFGEGFDRRCGFIICRVTSPRCIIPTPEPNSAN